LEERGTIKKSNGPQEIVTGTAEDTVSKSLKLVLIIKGKLY
jgi:hypothetical protein